MEIQNRTKACLAAFLIFASLGIPIPAEAGFSLGSVATKTHAEAIGGDTVSFSLLLYNIRDPSEMTARIRKRSLPEGWTMDIDPEEMEIPYTRPEMHTEAEPGYEYLSIPNSDESIKIRPVDVKVRIPESVIPGDYVILLEVDAEKGEGGISVMQSRTYDFTVKVISGTHEGSSGTDANFPKSSGSGFIWEEESNKSGESQVLNITDGMTKTEDMNENNGTGFPEPVMTGRVTDEAPDATPGLIAWAFVIIIILIIWRRR